jgi:hypothetical protein
LHPQWVDQLEIQKINYPNINRAVNREKGHAVGKTLREKKVSHCPLSLRDAYAIRAAILGISPAIAAKWMGHSIQTHYKHYLRWLDKEDFDRTWQGLR